MRIAIVGAGVAGVTLALELATDGHDVAVFELGNSTSAGGSYAHAGVIEAALAVPWALTDDAATAARIWWGREGGVRLHSRADLAMAGWWRALRRAAASSREALLHIARSGQRRFGELQESLKLDCELTHGLLVPARTEADQARYLAIVDALKPAGIAAEWLDVEGCHRVEPWLGQETPLRGGLYFAAARAGNGRQFTNLLRAEAQRRGARFRFHSRVLRITPGVAPELVHVHEERDARAGPFSQVLDREPADEGPSTEPLALEPAGERFDAIVLCNAIGAGELLQSHGVRLPLTPVHGHSITAPLRLDDRHPDRGPRAAVYDPAHGVAITHLGTRVRVSGQMEIGGAVGEPREASLNALYAVLHDWFPGVANLAHVLPWRGTRAMAPDARPLIGATRLPGIWLNVGLGDQGWAIACAAARALADGFSQRPAGLDLTAFQPGRFD